MLNKAKMENIEYSIKDLSESKFFPFKSGKINQLIKEKKIRVVRYGPRTIRIEHAEVIRFLNSIKKCE